MFRKRFKGNTGENLQTLSSDEIKFIIKHIKGLTQMNIFAMKLILQLIKEGKNNPSRIEANVSDKFLVTKRP